MQPRPAGARKSIFHPNEIDIKVLDAMISFEASEETPKLQMDWIAEKAGIDKTDVQRSIKWLNTADFVETQSRGRGTHYLVKVQENNLTPVDPTTLGDSYRKPGGPTVRKICRTVFNGLEPLQRIAPAKMTEIAQAIYPELGLTRQSFGQVFTKMASIGEIYFEGNGRSRKYWRAMDQIEDAAEGVPEGFDFSKFFAEETPAANETETVVEDSTETTEDTNTDNDDNFTEDAIVTEDSVETTEDTNDTETAVVA